MNKKQRSGRIARSPPYKRGRPVNAFNEVPLQEKPLNNADLQPVKEETKAELVEEPVEVAEHYEQESEKFTDEVERFIEISKYFSSPLRKTASYLSEHRLVSYPSSFRIEYKRGGVTTEHVKFCNLTLEPVYVKLFKLTPDLEQIKFINLSLSMTKRIPPGLSFSLGFVYDDVNEKESLNSKMIFVASRKTTTPCYQICEIELDIHPLKIRQHTA